MKKLLLFLIMIFSIQVTYSQFISREVNATSGDYFTNSTSSISWTIGEALSESFVSDNIILTQGFQQSLFYFFSIDENSDSVFIINIFPNPTSKILNIKIDSKFETKVLIQLFDINGNCLLEKRINGNRNFNEVLNFDNYKNSMYLLKIISVENQIIKSYKIQKIN